LVLSKATRNNRNAILNPSLSILIMWGSRPLLTVSTTVITVLHSTEVVHFHHKSRKSFEELWTQPCCAKVGTIPHFRGVVAYGHYEAFTKSPPMCISP
jgi:hypothetical protein